MSYVRQRQNILVDALDGGSLDQPAWMWIASVGSIDAAMD